MGLQEETANGPDVATHATEDLARQLEEANLAFLRSGAGSDEAAEVHRARRLVVAIAVNYVFFALVLGIAGAVFGDRNFQFAALGAGGFGATSVVALALIRRGRVGVATLVAGYGVLLSVPVYSLLMPSAHAGVVLLPIFAVGMMHVSPDPLLYVGELYAAEFGEEVHVLGEWCCVRDLADVIPERAKSEKMPQPL